MAIKIADEYPNSEPVSADYPGGSFKDDSTGATGDGTPYQKAWPNDIYGFLQALIATAGVVPSGTPDTAVASQYLEAMEAIMWQPGDYKLRSGSQVGRRWLECNGYSIGNAASNATARANADTYALFAVLWAEAAYTIRTSGGVITARGGSAAADFAANKQMSLPEWRGEGLRVWSHGRAGVDVGRTLGSWQGEMVGPHSHPIDTRGTNAILNNEVEPASPTNYGEGSGPDVTSGYNAGTENRMRNRSALMLIRY